MFTAGKKCAGTGRKIVVWVFVLVGVVMLALGLAFFFNSDTWVLREGEKLAEAVPLEGKDFYSLKEGWYCGEGGCKEDHGTGYLYYTDAFSDSEAMEEAGFEETEEYYTADGEEKREYANGGEWAVIVRIGEYKEGHLLMYHIVGMA